MEALGINPGFLIAQIVNFLVIFAVLSIVWKALTKMLDERSRTIAEGVERAEQADQRRAEAEKAYEERLSQAEVDARKVISDAQTKAEEAEAAIHAEAEAEAAKIRAHAHADAEAERDRVLAEMRGQIAALSIAAANRLVGEAMDEKRQQALVADFFSKVPADIVDMGGAKVEIISALPLTDAEKKSAQESIGAEDVTFKVDPSILGGLIVKSGDRVIDGSHLGQLQKMRERLQ